MNTTHDTSISWMDCPVCAELHRGLEYASEKAQDAWRTYDSLDAEYRMAMDDGRLGFGTTAWSQWRDLLDQLRQQYYAAEDAKRASIKAWGDSILMHDGRKPQPAAKAEADGADLADRLDRICMIDISTPCTAPCCNHDRDDGAAETEEMGTVSKTDADDIPATARDAYAQLLYGDVPDFELPDDIMDGSWALLHAASAAISAYMRLLEQYAPATAKGYPAWVANRLRDVLDEAAIQRAITDQGGGR